MSPTQKKSLTNEVIHAMRDLKLLQDFIKASSPAQQTCLLKKMNDALLENILEDGSQNTALKVKKAIKLYDYKPANVPFYDFAFDNDLNNIAGNFSSFDYKLSAMYRNNEKQKTIKNYIKSNLKNCGSVAEQYAYDIQTILSENPGLARRASNIGLNGDKGTFSKLLQTIVNKLTEQRSLKLDTKVFVIDSWDDAPQYVSRPAQGIKIYAKEVRVTKGNTTVPEIYINRQIIYKGERCINSKELLENILAILAHEFGHVVDFYAPNQGSLGNQIAALNQELSVAPSASTMEQYMANPTEVSSFAIQRAVMRSFQQNQR